eukprot:TRINITY_DN13630_c0_g2_i1.p1 TRINITY_DN13630_c0_g2~~TRINITY_DN13630_c0_g2_i1.p1  ORF type:complete len:502 (+),score=60.46 TRINITY_DN13630_c0_g2_i1:141-1508(+)
MVDEHSSSHWPSGTRRARSAWARTPVAKSPTPQWRVKAVQPESTNDQEVSCRDVDGRVPGSACSDAGSTSSRLTKADSVQRTLPTRNRFIVGSAGAGGGSGGNGNHGPEDRWLTFSRRRYPAGSLPRSWFDKPIADNDSWANDASWSKANVSDSSWQNWFGHKKAGSWRTADIDSAAAPSGSFWSNSRGRQRASSWAPRGRRTTSRSRPPASTTTYDSRKGRLMREKAAVIIQRAWRRIEGWFHDSNRGGGDSSGIYCHDCASSSASDNGTARSEAGFDGRISSCDSNDESTSIDVQHSAADAVTAGSSRRAWEEPRRTVSAAARGFRLAEGAAGEHFAKPDSSAPAAWGQFGARSPSPGQARIARRGRGLSYYPRGGGDDSHANATANVGATREIRGRSHRGCAVGVAAPVHGTGAYMARSASRDHTAVAERVRRCEVGSRSKSRSRADDMRWQ